MKSLVTLSKCTWDGFIVVGTIWQNSSAFIETSPIEDNPWAVRISIKLSQEGFFNRKNPT